jgi:glycosyltransferase 2 family protein
VKQLTWKLLKAALLAAVLWFVGKAIARDVAKVEDWSSVKPDWFWTALAGIALLGVSAVQMIGYRSLLKAYGYAMSWDTMASVAWVPPLGKYVPGKIWALGGAMAMLKKLGVPVAIAATVVLMLDGLAVVTGLMVGASVALKPVVSDRIPGVGWMVGVCVIVGMVVLHPRVFTTVLNRLLSKMKRPLISTVPTLNQYALPVGCALAQWVFAGTALWCMSRALTDVPLTSLPGFIPLAACAMTISYLALFAPAGVGVREAIYLALLPQLIPGASAGAVVVVVVSMRLLQTLIEVALAGLGWVMLKKRAGTAAG